MTHSLLDTSIVIASGEASLPESGGVVAISVVTIGELHAGVRLADDPQLRSLRQARLNAVRARFEPIPVDETIAHQYGELLALARSKGRSTKATDLLILATAAATGRTLLTLDASQASLARAAGVPVNH